MKDGSNWHIYVNNNPINYTDPTGLITQRQYDQNMERAKALSSRSDEEIEAEFETHYKDDIKSESDEANNRRPTRKNTNNDSDTTTPTKTAEEIEDENMQSLLDGFLGIFGLESQENNTFKIGVGVGGYLIVGGGIELGIAGDSSGDISPYLTINVGVGVAVTSKFTPGFSTDKGTTVKTLDDNISTSSSIGFGPMVTYDNDSRFSGAGGIGAGGAVSRSMTFTKHSITQTVEVFKEMVNTVNNNFDAYADKYRNIIR